LKIELADPKGNLYILDEEKSEDNVEIQIVKVKFFPTRYVYEVRVFAAGEGTIKFEPFYDDTTVLEYSFDFHIAE